MGKYKYLVIFIALVTFGLVGCGNTNTSDKGTEATTSRQEVESYAKIKPVCYVIIIRMNQEYGMLKENNILTDLY